MTHVYLIVNDTFAIPLLFTFSIMFAGDLGCHA